MRYQGMIMLLLVAALCIGCGKQEEQDKGQQVQIEENTQESIEEQTSKEPYTENFNSEMTQQEPQRSRICEYTNMADEETQKEMDALLENAGVSKERRKNFFEHVNQFNEAVDQSVLYAGFVNEDILNVPYDPYDLQEQWSESHSDFIGYNCRITSYGLYGDYLEIDETGESRDQDLFRDVEALESDASVLKGENDMEKFLRLFSIVPTQPTKDIRIHVRNILQDWEDRNISFKKNTRMELVTVWFHNQWSPEENELFIGHTGVLVYGKDGLYFFEKVAFQEPYQVVKLNTKKQLLDYLIEKYDIAWGQETAAPFILINDKLLAD